MDSSCTVLVEDGGRGMGLLKASSAHSYHAEVRKGPSIVARALKAFLTTLQPFGYLVAMSSYFAPSKGGALLNFYGARETLMKK